MLRAMPAAMLPRGLQKIRDERCTDAPEPEESSSTDVLQMFAMQDNAPVAQQDEGVAAMLAPAAEAHNDVEDIILLAQGGTILPPEGVSLKEKLAQIERAYIEQALNRSEGNVSKTARLLNLQRTTLIEKIDKYRLRSV